MNRDDIIRMAREAGFPQPDISLNWLETLERFAEAIWNMAHEEGYNEGYNDGYDAAAETYNGHTIGD